MAKIRSAADPPARDRGPRPLARGGPLRGCARAQREGTLTRGGPLADSASAGGRSTIAAHIRDGAAATRAPLNPSSQVLCMFARGDPRAKAAMLFRMFDLDGGGDLDARELNEFMHTASRALYRMGQVPRRLSKRGVRKLGKQVLKAADTDRNGRVDWEEFFVWAQAAGTTRSLAKTIGKVAEEDDGDGGGAAADDAAAPTAAEAAAAMAEAAAADGPSGDAAAPHAAAGAARAPGGPGPRQRRWSVAIMGGVDLDLEALGGTAAAAELARAAAAVRASGSGPGGAAVPSEAAIEAYLERLLSKADKQRAAVAGPAVAAGSSRPSLGAATTGGGGSHAAPSLAADPPSARHGRRSSMTDASDTLGTPVASKAQRKELTRSFRSASRRFDGGGPSLTPAMSHGVVLGPDGPAFSPDRFIGSLHRDDDEPGPKTGSRGGGRSPGGGAPEGRVALSGRTSPLNPSSSSSRGPASSRGVSPHPPSVEGVSETGSAGLRAGLGTATHGAPSRQRSPEGGSAHGARTAAGTGGAAGPGDPAGGRPQGFGGGLSIRAPEAAAAALAAAAHGLVAPAGADSPLPLPIRPGALIMCGTPSAAGSPTAAAPAASSPGPGSPFAMYDAPGPGTPASVMSSTGSAHSHRAMIGSGGGFARDATSRLPPGARLSSLRQRLSPHRLSPLGQALHASSSAHSLASLDRLGEAATALHRGGRGRLSLRGSGSPLPTGSAGGDATSSGPVALSQMLADAAAFSLPSRTAAAGGGGFTPTRGDLAGGIRPRADSTGQMSPPLRPRLASAPLHPSPPSAASPGSTGAAATPGTTGGASQASPEQRGQPPRASGVAHQPLLWGRGAGGRQRTSSLSATVARARREVSDD